MNGYDLAGQVVTVTDSTYRAYVDSSEQPFPTSVLLDGGVVQRAFLGVRPAARLITEIDEGLSRSAS